MSISSMTGFSRYNNELILGNVALNWYFELKSVNGKSLEVKLKTPSWLDAISPSVKNVASKYFSRGNVGAYLDMNLSRSSQSAKINEDLLSELTGRAIKLYNDNNENIKKPSASELLSIKGVVELEDAKLSDEELEILQNKLVVSFEEACKELKKDRIEEGKKIEKALFDILQKIESIVAGVEKIGGSLPSKFREKLDLQVKNLMDTPGITEERIAQEVVFMALKADIKEEIDRLKAHIKTAKELLASSDPVGRRLDFLCQELNREANTTCSKSSDIELTNLGMELKTLIEQFREQIQNVE